MKKVFYIIGAGFIVGAATAAVLYLLSSKKKKDCGVGCDYQGSDEESAAADDELSTEVTLPQDGPVYEDVKSSAIESMYSRHESADTIMSDSVETIRENIKVSESTNNKIDEVSAELDKMLSED